MARKDTDWFTIDDQNFVPGDAVTATSAYKWVRLATVHFCVSRLLIKALLMHHTRPVMWFVLLTCVHLALAVDPGCSQEHPYRLLKDETSNEFACFNIAWTKAFDGYCGGEEADREIRMFHGNGDNPNDIVETCAKACVEQKSPVAMEGEKESHVERCICVERHSCQA